MKVTMLEAREAALDGVNFVELEKGEIYDVPEFLADSYVERGIAEKASEDAPVAIADAVPDPEAPSAPEDENGKSSAGDAQPPADEGPSLEELEALSRDELNKLAKKAEIESPDKLANKKAVAEALIAARGE